MWQAACGRPRGQPLLSPRLWKGCASDRENSVPASVVALTREPYLVDPRKLPEYTPADVCGRRVLDHRSRRCRRPPDLPSQPPTPAHRPDAPAAPDACRPPTPATPPDAPAPPDAHPPARP